MNTMGVITPAHLTRPEPVKVKIPELEDVHMKTLPQEPHMQKLFIDVVRNIIANNGKLGYLKDGYTLGIENGYDWRTFCEEFISKKKTIADFFCVPDKFQLQLFKEKYHEIKYGGSS